MNNAIFKFQGAPSEGCRHPRGLKICERRFFIISNNPSNRALRTLRFFVYFLTYCALSCLALKIADAAIPYRIAVDDAGSEKALTVDDATVDAP